MQDTKSSYNLEKTRLEFYGGKKQMLVGTRDQNLN
jgi:hypothetical protein